jgi:hypothetical protein
MRVGPTVNDVQLTGLLPNTEYEVTVQAVLYDLTSEPAKAREVTCKMLLSSVSYWCKIDTDVSDSLTISAWLELLIFSF